MESWNFGTGKDVKDDLIQLPSSQMGNPRLRETSGLPESQGQPVSGEAPAGAPPAACCGPPSPDYLPRGARNGTV